MKRQKKTLCLSLSLALMMGTFSACTQEVEPVIERVEITYWDKDCANMMPGSYTETLIEAALPVDIVVNRTDHNQITKVVELLTAGKMPDVVWYNGKMETMVERDLIRSIPYDMVAKYAPSFLDLYEASPTVLTAIMNPNDNSEFWALSGITEQSSRVANSQFADFYRYDWIEALDIDLGVNVTQLTDQIYVADTGLTLDKFEEVMDAFTYGDPDGNGVDDTFGASFESMLRFELMYSAFGITNGVNEEDGIAKQHYATEGFREFVLWFQDMYRQDYIDPDFYLQDRTDRWAKVENSEYGYFLESSIALNSWASNRPPLSMIESNPEAKFLLTPGLSDNEGNAVMEKIAMPTSGYLCYISKSVDDEKLAVILETLEYMNFGDEKLSMWFGEEGIDWKMDENGNVVEINTLEIAEKGARNFVQNVQTGELFEAVTFQETFLAGANFWLDECLWRENDREQYQYKLDLQKETDYDALYAQYGGACFAVMEDYFQQWIYDGLDVNESWEDYLLALDEAGYGIMMAELEKIEPLEEMMKQYTMG